MRNISILICCLLAICQPITAQKEWKLQKDRHGVKIYYREAADSPIKELKIVTQAKSTLSAALAVLQDVPNLSKWVYRCSEAKMIKVVSPSVYHYSNITDFPWPMYDREFVMRCTTWQEPTTLIVHSGSTAIPDAIPADSRYLRVRKTESWWTFKPLGNGMIEIEYYLKSDPGGNIPSFLINAALDSGPLYSLEKFKKLVQQPAYAKARLSYIKEK
jgi:hypothetical protein